MAYRDDPDLKFLGSMDSSDLNDLVYCLVYDKDGSSRLTEELSTTPEYKSHYPDHRRYWQQIAAEIQCFGGNTIATMLRGGKGVLYREVLEDVCDKLKVNYNKGSSIDLIEQNLLSKILRDALEKMSAEEIKALGESIGLKNTNLFTAEAMFGVFQTVFRAGGFKSYQLTAIVVNAVLKALIGRGLSFAATGTMMRTMAVITGPIGWVVTGAWTAVDIASPAFRVTIPTVIQIAALRQKQAYGAAAEQVSFG
ncbi:MULTISPECIES: DUF3944 domain-containing protein [Gammaproteobacteria]|uniref:DUF3944 domain-containing protein n=1 Tax=Gammaproteobacteria TaxID=1236 RepID=UPI00141F94F0|nr:MULTISPECIES: DUF3944 domain-containing protein [Gammaproteobacteria]MBM7396548.1 uncharacterized protein YaaW (UPF0174 family) [Pseudomonas sp. M5]NIE74145.1 DUF3944 domain-containing protein [Pantoea sp. Ap-967]HDS1754466.1 DUF3944 domain-containing protein [Pseudomonas putida]